MLYAMITNQCNLSCPHCNIIKEEDDYNEEAFLSKISEFDGRIVIFGGEPTLHIDRIEKVLKTPNKQFNISTNLLILNRRLINLYKHINIATSWNPTRFTADQYQLWLSNLKYLEKNHLSCMVMITIDKLLIDIKVEDFMHMIRDWDKNYKSITVIKMEHVIDHSIDNSFFEEADLWLCELYKNWNVNLKHTIFDKIEGWYLDCNHIFTLYPNGKIVNRCPHPVPIQFVNECFTCDRIDKCKPCRLQKYCSYPKKLYQLIKDEKAG